MAGSLGGGRSGSDVAWAARPEEGRHLLGSGNTVEGATIFFAQGNVLRKFKNPHHLSIDPGLFFYKENVVTSPLK